MWLFAFTTAKTCAFLLRNLSLECHATVPLGCDRSNSDLACNASIFLGRVNVKKRTIVYSTSMLKKKEFFKIEFGICIITDNNAA